MKSEHSGDKLIIFKPNYKMSMKFSKHCCLLSFQTKKLASNNYISMFGCEMSKITNLQLFSLNIKLGKIWYHKKLLFLNYLKFRDSDI